MGQSRCRRAAGFTMLEALVAIVVLAFGVLGVANLLIKSFRFAQQSSYDIVAMQLANDMAERMRSNGNLTDSGTFNAIDTQNGAPVVTGPGNLYNGACTGGAATCAPLAANFELAEWTQRVQSSLPGGRAIICRDATTYGLTTGYQWACNAATGGTNSTTDTPLVIKIGWVSRFTDRQGTDIATGTTMTDSVGANGTATPQMVVVVLPGVKS
ncbi:type IV pilus assembly protein PilV [Cupriavidus sp. YR651]|uniref:type IV pilus modification protein PilV n=1 Tax=Cupriavidus sp. YR651 TaxID=1855315 RepID=UPI000885DC96|nr:type IV pilus modification protein PilV [Cupriavidus sp. YR651]SDC20318.1 type IV pilus assembly protein PilV [Cupriavidus sp. YR651]